MLDIELTERCNLSCRHCYIRQPINGHDPSTSEMEPRFVSELLSEGKALGMCAVRFTGGEPLSKRGFAVIYRNAGHLGLDVNLSTNGTLITEELVDLFDVYPPCGISISMYGWDEGSYQAITGLAEGFEKFTRAVRLLRKHHLKYDLKYPPIPYLIENRARLVALARKLGHRRPLAHVWELTLRARREEQANECLRQMRLPPRQAAEARLQEPNVRNKEYRALASLNGKRFSGRLLACRAGKDRLTIDAYGRLQLCLELRHPSTIYDLHDGTIRDAITTFIPQMLALTVQNQETIERCSHCILYKRCIMCPAVSWMENGDLDSISEYHCDVMHAEAEILGILSPEQKGWETSLHH